MSNAHTDEDLERCTLNGRREILFQLRSLIRQNERVSVTFDEGRQSFLTVLMDISSDEGTLYFDIGGSDETNAAFLKSERCQFAGIVGGIRIQFSGRSPRQVRLSGETVFAVAVPGSLLRLQRRDAFRLQLPTTKPYICRVQRGTPDEIALPLYDISVCGLGIQVSEQPQFEPMQKLENCWLDLRESGIFPVTLEVRYIRASESFSHKPIWHLGCKFIDLAQANETLIQRFMARIEVERRALSTD
jgi:c-di-GMP-binding flagellar brake protein YcgR